jgi:O-antigen/teichoic acid export membrane protein
MTSSERPRDEPGAHLGDTFDAQPAELSGFAAETTGKNVSRAGAWNAFSHLIPQVYLLVQSVAAARFLGPEDMGRQSFIAWAAVSLVFVWSKALPDAVLRFAAETLGRERPGDVLGLARWATRVEVAAAAVAGAGIAAIGIVRGDLRDAWLLAAVVCAMNVLRSIPLALLRARLRWRESSMIGVWSGLFAMTGTVVVLALGHGIVAMFAVEAAVGVGATLYARRRAHASMDELPGPPTPDAGLQRRVSRYAAAAAFQAVFAYVVWQRSEFVFLDHYAGDAEIALYSVAFGGVSVITRVLQGFAAVVPGSVATLYGAGALDRIKRGYARSVRLLLVLTFPVTAVSAALAPVAIDLVYGDEYARAGRVLLVVLAAVPAVALFHLAFGLVQGLGRLRVLFAASVAGTVADFGFAFLLVPRHGAFGAAIANTAAQVAASFVVLAYAARFASGADWGIARLARAALAAAAAGGIAWVAVEVLPPLPALVVGGLAGLAAYAAFLRLLRVVPADDREWLAQALGTRGHWVARLLG